MDTVRIDILIPVLARPDRAARVVQSIRASASRDPADVRITFICSPHDHAQFEAAVDSGADDVLVMAEDPGPGDYARKINHGFRACTGDWVFTGADDLDFHDGWAEAVLAAGAAGVIGTNDLCNPLVMRGGHSTHSLVSRAYVNDIGGTYHDGPGMVLHEGYDHQWIDNELVQAAQARGQWAFARDAHVEHLHPLCGKGEMDDTYRKALAEGTKDSHLFRKRTREFVQFRRRGRIR